MAAMTVRIRRDPGTPLHEILRLMKLGYSAEVIYMKITSKEYLYSSDEIRKDLIALKLIHNLLGRGMTFSMRGYSITFSRKIYPVKFSVQYTRNFEYFYEKKTGYRILLRLKNPRNLSSSEYTKFTQEAINYKRYLNDVLGKIYASIGNGEVTNVLPHYYLLKNVCKGCGPYGLAFFKCFGGPGNLDKLYEKRIPTAQEYWKILNRMVYHYEEAI